MGPFLADSNRPTLNETGGLFDTTTAAIDFVTASNASKTSNALLANQTLADEIVQRTAIFVPFTFGGSLFVLCGIAMTACWIFKPYVPPARSLDGKDADRARELQLTECEKECLLMPNRWFYAIFVFLTICLFSIEQCMEYQFLYFVSLFLKYYLHLEGTENTNLIALIGLAYIIGRGLNVLVSALRIPVTIMLYLNIILLFAGSTLILFISPSSDHLSTLITVAVCLMGLGYASSLPGNLQALPIIVTFSIAKNHFFLLT